MRFISTTVEKHLSINLFVNLIVVLWSVIVTVVSWYIVYATKWRFSWLSGKYTTIDALSLTRSEHAVIVIVSSTRMNFTLQASKVKHPSYLEATWLEIFDRIYYWSTNWLYVFKYFLFFFLFFFYDHSKTLDLSVASTT